MPDPSTTVSALVRHTWDSWKAGTQVDYLAVLKQCGYQPPSSDPEEFGLFDSLNFLGLSVTHCADFSYMDTRALSPEVLQELSELTD